MILQMNPTSFIFTNIIKKLILFLCLLLIIGCASGKYLLDEPVNDPIMTTDDQQDNDLAKVEDGGFGGAGGECPT